MKIKYFHKVNDYSNILNTFGQQLIDRYLLITVFA
jgi:hypothetical protein